jgi:hypothetical protein
MAMENPPFGDDFHILTSMYMRFFQPAIFEYRGYSQLFCSFWRLRSLRHVPVAVLTNMPWSAVTDAKQVDSSRALHPTAWEDDLGMTRNDMSFLDVLWLVWNMKWIFPYIGNNNPK